MDIQNISDSQLDALFGTVDTPIEATPQNIISETEVQPSREPIDGLPNIDFDALEAAAEKAATETPADTSTTIEEETPTIEKEKESLPIEETTIETAPEVKDILKNTVSYLIEKGLWKDFDGREEMEIDESTYAELAVSQNTHSLNEMFNELVDSTGAYGKAIIEHIKEGGNPDTIIDIFKEQKEIKSIDTSSDEGKLDLIGNYYTDVLGWKPDRIKKHLTRIIADNDLETEFSEINEQYDEYYQQQLAAVNQQREEAKKFQAEKQREFVSNIQTTLSEMGYTDKEKKLIEKSLLDVKKLPNGQVATDFNLRFSQLQKDPKKLIKLVEFVMDEENFINKITKTAETQAAEKTFKFIKGNSTTSKKTAVPTVQNDSKQNNLDFSSLLNK